MLPRMLAVAGLLAFSAPAALAQTPPGCDGMDHRGDFDFWVGDWNVYGPGGRKTSAWHGSSRVGDWNVYGPGGQFGGTNRISKRSNGCLILEEWTSAAGGDGTSMNYLDPATGAWRQIWMGSNTYIDYSGGLNDDGQMELEGEITYFGTNGSRSAPFRGVWTPNDDGSVTQHFTQYNAETESWDIWFTGRYVRQEEDPNTPSGE